MVQVDLITGFLGAGKTTFLRRYAAYLAGQGERVCILENDFGAVNVDAMLVQDLLELGCEIETISGGCDCDTHQRRMRTKLISMAMRGFTRVLVEPSGIFDVDEFFDVLRDDPLDRWYQLGNVIAIVDALLPEQLSPQADYVLASECANAGLVLLSRSQLAKPGQCEAAVAHLKRALTACKCSRVFQPEEILAKDWAALTEADMARIARCGMRQASCEKLHFEEHEAFSSAYFLELGLPRARLERNIPGLFTDPVCGRVLRVKGFVEEFFAADRQRKWGKNLLLCGTWRIMEPTKPGRKNPMNGTLLQKPSARRVIGMVVGIVIIGLGIALFKQSHLGNDSISALNMRLAELFGISLGVQNIAANLLMFAIEIWVGRQYIGLGTFVNGICIGFIVTAFYDPIAAFFGPAASLPEQLLWVAAAVIVTALGASLYQTADLGIAPYDALALELRDHTPVPYFGCRVFTDAVCALACWMLGGLVGLGTLICAFCLGPVIQFFNGHFSEKVLRYQPRKT